MKQAVKRMPRRPAIAVELATSVEFASNRTCCVCTTPNKDIQIHHIDGNPANNDIRNLAILCLQCHSEAERTSGLGRRLSAAYVARAKITWEDRVELLRQHTGLNSNTSLELICEELQEIETDLGTEVSRFDQIDSGNLSDLPLKISSKKI